MTSNHPEGTQAFLLNEQLGWRSAVGSAAGTATGATLTLAADPHGKLALSNPDGSLGRLVLPRRMALDADLTLHLLVKRAEADCLETTILRFNALMQQFEALPEIGGWISREGHTADARRFHPSAGIAIHGKALYVADPVNARVQVFDLISLALRHLWTLSTEWQPTAVAAAQDAVYILDRAQGRVYAHRPGTDRLTLVIDQHAERGGAWTRIAVDRDERIYLYYRKLRVLEIFAFDPKRGWCWQETADDAGDVRDRFEPPGVVVESSSTPGRPDWFCLPPSLRRPAGRQLPHLDQAQADVTCSPAQPDVLCFAYRTGEPLDLPPEERVGLPLYCRDGVWVSTALDSELYRCQWHRLIVDIAQLPPGARIDISTFSSVDLQTDEYITALREEFWERGFSLVGTLAADQPPTGVRDGLVQSREGQYLWLRIRMWGDGYGTPAINSLRVQFPRDSYLKYLPTVFAQDEESRWFLERYLSIAQTEWEDIERRVRESARLFDPEAVPGGAALKYLASWYAVNLEGEWSDEQNRRLLSGAQRLFGRRGTLDGLRTWLRVYLGNFSGVSEADQESLAVPMLLESYRARAHLQMQTMQTSDETESTADTLGTGLPLWGDTAVNRFQLGVNSTEGEAQMISMGDPQIDRLSFYAHRFEVYVPAIWVRTAAEEQMLRRALDAEKPAHTAYELHLVEARLRIGVQAMLGVDAIVGALPTPQPLGQEPGSDSDAAPSREAQGRLGYDTVLDQAPTVYVTPRVGRDSCLI